MDLTASNMDTDNLDDTSDVAQPLVMDYNSDIAENGDSLSGKETDTLDGQPLLTENG